MKCRTLLLITAISLLATLVLPVQLAAQQTVSGINGRIAFNRQIGPDTAGIFTADADGTNEQQVPFPPDNRVEGGAVWSPDGMKLLISHTFRPDASGNCCLPFRPAIVNPDGSEFTLLSISYGPFDMDCPAWSHDQTRILCGFGDEGAGIFSIRASDGGDPVRLTTCPF